MTARDLRVERRRNHTRQVSIYDRFGGGSISLTVEEAEHVRERLDEVLDSWEEGVALELYELAEEANFPDEPGSHSKDHIWWMIGELETGKVTGRKAHRWLGWIQCAIVASGRATLDEMKQINQENI